MTSPAAMSGTIKLQGLPGRDEGGAVATNESPIVPCGSSRRSGGTIAPTELTSVPQLAQNRGLPTSASPHAGQNRLLGLTLGWMTSIDLPPLTSCLSCCPGNGIGTKLVTFNITLHRWRQPAATSSCRIGLPMGTGPLSSWRNSVSRLGDLGGREPSGFLPFRSVSLLGSVAR